MGQHKEDNYDSGIIQLVDNYEKRDHHGAGFFLTESDFARLIDYYEDQMRYDHALEVAELAIDSHIYSVDFYLRKAQLLLLLKRETEVMAVLDQAAGFSPNDTEITLLRAETLAYLDRIEEALEELKPLKEVAKAEALSDILLVESMIYEHNADYELVFQTLAEALRANPKNEDALERIWLCSELSHNFADSIRLHEWIIDEDPYSHRAWFNLGHALASLARYDEAIEAYEYAFIIKEDFEEAYFDCGDLCFELKRYHQAVQCYRELEERFDLEGDLLLQIGQCYQYLNRLTDAAQYFERARRLDPHNEEVVYQMGENYALREMWPQALRYYRMAVRMDESEEAFHVGAALAAQQLQKNELAEHHFLSAVRLAPDLPHVWSPYAFFLVEEGRWREALDMLAEANDTCTDTELDYCRVACLFMANRHTEACQVLSQTLALHYENHELLLGWMPELIDDPRVSALLYTYRP